MVYKYKILLVVAPAVFLLDLFTKWLVLQSIPIGDSIVVIPNFFDLVHVRNTGAAFGMFARLSEDFRIPFFYMISGVAILVLIYCFLTLNPKDHRHSLPLSLITAGVFGNLLDRIRFGSVVDFISLHVGDKSISGVELRWPAFNVADSAITISVVILIAYSLRGRSP